PAPAAPLAPAATPTPEAAATTPPETAAAPKAAADDDDDLAASAASLDDYVAIAYRNDTETRARAIAASRRALADRVEQVLGGFIDIGGYFRAGYGRDSQGGPLLGFQAPGAPAKYRLGNEAETYGELIFGKNIYLPGAFKLNDQLRPDQPLAGPVARVQVRMSFVSPYSGSGTGFDLPEAWAAIGNVIPGQPLAKFWAGRRFYRRHDIHANDFYFWDMSGGGGGIEDVQAGPVKLALAWIGFGTSSGISSLPEPDPANVTGFTKSNYDLRVYDMPFLFGKAEVGFTVATMRGGTDAAGNEAETETGVAASFVYTLDKFISDDGTNKFSLQYGTSAAKTFTAGLETVGLPQGSFVRSEQEGSWRFRVTEHFSANVGEHFSVGPVAVYQSTKQTDGTGQQHWLSAGVRPIVHFNHYFNLALEGGVDWVKDSVAETEGTLGKITIAPQVSISNRWASRPVIRAFGTAAFWSDDFVGQVGGIDHANSSNGLSAGVQMETWW
ncbi:MAG TPA: carbohydrate porin, partial [Polyangiaceae bacterium]